MYRYTWPRGGDKDFFFFFKVQKRGNQKQWWQKADQYLPFDPDART
jgi:hypothetical protein